MEDTTLNDKKSIDKTTIAKVALCGGLVIGGIIGYGLCQSSLKEKLRVERLAKESSYLRTKLLEATRKGSTCIYWINGNGVKEEFLLKIIK